MPTVKHQIPDDVRAILQNSSIQGNVLVLPQQLDRPTYERVNKILTAMRGKWDRKAKGHVFPFNPIDLLAEATDAGEIVDAKKTLQIFETPEPLAIRMAELANVITGDHVLEPSAGSGRLVRALLDHGAEVRAIEPDEINCNALRKIGGSLLVYEETFERWRRRYSGDPQFFDAIVMNPPFSGNMDTSHIMAAWEHLKPGGRLVAICSEGPFFRENSASDAFREWLAEIGATTERLPTETFRESGTTVATRLITATRPFVARREAPEVRDAANVTELPIEEVRPDPDQPRKTFDKTVIRELAASIAENGLLQPITVRPSVVGGYVIITGETRYRAHRLNGASKIRCIISDVQDEATIRVRQIVENDQRANVPPLEQARAYQRLMDEQKWDVEELGRRIGKAPHRITERTALLALQDEYQQLFESGAINPSQATEIARQPTARAQDLLFQAIKAGRCKTYADLRVTSLAISGAAAQTTFEMDEPPPASAEDRQLAATFEDQVNRVAWLLGQGIRDNQIVALKKTNPHRAGILADKMAAMQTDLRRIEVALREMAIQAELMRSAA